MSCTTKEQLLSSLDSIVKHHQQTVCYVVRVDGEYVISDCLNELPLNRPLYSKYYPKIEQQFSKLTTVMYSVIAQLEYFYKPTDVVIRDTELVVEYVAEHANLRLYLVPQFMQHSPVIPIVGEDNISVHDKFTQPLTLPTKE